MIKTNWLIVSAALAIFTSGCANKPKPATAEFFPDPAGAETRAILETQAQSGASADAMLRPQHFEGAYLNSLGRAKLDLIIRDSESGLPLVVYLNVPGRDSAAGRQAVTAYLTGAGFQSSQFSLLDGPNTATFHPVAADIEHLAKTDTSGGAANTQSMQPNAGPSGGMSGK